MAQTVKNLPAMQEIWVRCLGQEDPLEKKIPLHSSFPGEFRGQRNLSGYSSRGCKESNTTERLTLSAFRDDLKPVGRYACIGYMQVLHHFI